MRQILKMIQDEVDLRMKQNEADCRMRQNWAGFETEPECITSYQSSRLLPRLLL